MNIQTVQVDGKMPNLALCKIRSYHRQHGDQVNGSGHPDKVYISCIFPKNRSTALGIATGFPHSQVILGGSGLNYGVLPKEIEDTKVDWPAEGMDYAMGFTSRGCIRKCPFCIVPAKEGHIREHHDISHIANGMGKLILFDGNFLASRWAIPKLNELRDNGYKVCFSQGLILRLINEQNAGLLTDLKLQNLNFTFKTIYFAWDFIENEKPIRKGLEQVIASGIKPQYIEVYVLCGYNTTFQQDLYRFNILWKEYKVRPFIMLYNNGGDSVLRSFARYVNKMIYKSCSWEDYKRKPKIIEKSKNSIESFTVHAGQSRDGMRNSPNHDSPLVQMHGHQSQR